MLLHVFMLVSSGFKRAQACEISVNCKIYPPSHSLWNLNEMGQVFCEVPGEAGAAQKRGLKENRVNAWQLRTGHVVTVVLCRGHHT